MKTLTTYKRATPLITAIMGLGLLLAACGEATATPVGTTAAATTRLATTTQAAATTPVATTTQAAATTAVSTSSATPVTTAAATAAATTTSVATTGAHTTATAPATTAATTAAALSPATPPGATTTAPAVSLSVSVQEYPVPAGSGPHDVAPAADGKVWFTGQRSGELGLLDPATGQSRMVKLGPGSAPHGVIVGPDGAPWVTDSGLNAIVRVDPATYAVKTFPVPSSRPANLNTAAFDGRGVLWFTGQNGFYGSLDPASGQVNVYQAPGGAGPYGITGTPDGSIYYASLAGNHIARVDTRTGQATRLDPPTPGQGARRVWSDARNRIWVSEYNSGQLSLYDPSANSWKQWKLPGPNPRAYAVYVDQAGFVWVSDFSSTGLVRFDPATEKFETFPTPSRANDIRQILGRPGEVWGSMISNNRLVVYRTGS